jgi:hypothetical protein
LTEVCDKGSIFDLYSKENATFMPTTAWRMAKECALGFNHIHGMGYMHRLPSPLKLDLSPTLTEETCQ